MENRRSAIPPECRNRDNCARIDRSGSPARMIAQQTLSPRRLTSQAVRGRVSNVVHSDLHAIAMKPTASVAQQ
jgi:hypothetical protein